MSTCDCFRGTLNGPYNPKGIFKSLFGADVYLSIPVREQDTKGDLLFLPDAFGLASHNLELADEYAAQGFRTTIVNYFEDDALPEALMLYTPGTDLTAYGFSDNDIESIRNVDTNAWLQIHNPKRISTILDAFFQRYRQDIPVGTKLFILGHCFGGSPAFELAKGNQITASIIMHPSFVTGETNKELVRPTFVGLAESDTFTPDLIADTLTASKTWKNFYKISVYGGTVHGFASRADKRDINALKNLRSSFEDSIHFMAMFL